MAVDALAERLDLLIREGSIVRSRFSERMLRRLEVLFKIGALVEVRAGAGRRIQLADPGALNNWIRSEYPSGLLGTAQALPPRATAVANLRDSKRGRRKDEPRLVFMRGFGSFTLRAAKGILPVAAITKEYGVAGVLVDPKDLWTVTGVLAFVENLEVFLSIERIVPGVDAAMWTVGCLNGVLLKWLSEQPDLEAIHVGDYDPVGLDEYRRLREAFGERADLYVPEDLGERVARFGHKTLLVRSLAVLKRVRKGADQRVREVLEALDAHGLALEQEALVIGSEDD